MTAPAPALPLEARRALWARLWRECLLRPPANPTTGTDGVSAEAPADRPAPDPATPRPATDAA